MFSVKPGAGWSFKGENYEPPASVRFHLIIPLLRLPGEKQHFVVLVLGTKGEKPREILSPPLF